MILLCWALFCIAVLRTRVILTQILEDDRFNITSNVSGNLKGQQFIDWPKFHDFLILFHQRTRNVFRNVFVFRRLDAFCFHFGERTSFSQLRKGHKQFSLYLEVGLSTKNLFDLLDIIATFAQGSRSLKFVNSFCQFIEEKFMNEYNSLFEGKFSLFFLFLLIFLLGTRLIQFFRKSSHVFFFP